MVTLFTVLAQTSSKTSSLENSGLITGKIIDKQTSEPLEYVKYRCKEDGKVLTGEIPQRKDFYH
jgi:hypothetical protein